jgi:prepilin-type N-terminal cleavage/methylation domain-containing protein
VLQRLRVARKNESGFTLIELLIVIVILGVLAGIVVFAVGAFNDRGEKAACEAERKSVEVAVEAYRAKFSAYPQSAAAEPAGTVARIALLVNPDGNVATADGFIRDGTVDASIVVTNGGAVTGCP